MQALVGAGAADEQAIAQASLDLDPQVRRLAVRAAGTSGLNIDRIKKGLSDPAAMVRVEALNAVGPLGPAAACALSLRAASSDADLTVVVAALDQLARCGSVPEAIAFLVRAVNDLSEAGVRRGWHRSAHALLALAAAEPERATASLAQFSGSATWQLRLSAATAAATLNARAVLDQLAKDSDDRVANTALQAMGVPSRSAATISRASASTITAADLRRLAAPRARVTIRDLGRFDLALFTSEAPFTVWRFAERAAAGYYDGLALSRLTADDRLQTGGGAASETVLRDEVGLWPHVRGAVGIAANGRDTGTGDFFVDLADNPRRDHELTVFGQILNGIDIVDQVLDGDVIESIEIVP
jgi:cyclophilin family peptidyl-prolyl cis-trans isomerase